MTQKTTDKMKEEKYTLKSMVDFVLENAGWHDSTIRINNYDFSQRVVKYANFLKQPLGS